MSGNVNYQHKRTTIANKRPASGELEAGEIVLNIEDGQPGLFFKTETEEIIKVGPMTISDDPPLMNVTGTTDFLTGELWLDTSTGILKIYTGIEWVPSYAGTSMTTSPTPPASPVVGDLWYDDNDSDLYIYVGQNTNAWVNIGPGGGGGIATVAADAPNGPVDGQMWFDTDTGFLYIYDDTDDQWKVATGGGAAAILNTAFALSWDNDISNGPSRNTIYDIFNGLTVNMDPDWNLGSSANIDITSGAVVDVESGGLLNVSDGGEINLNVNSTLSAASGSNVELDTQVDLQSNSTLLAASGATIDLDDADLVTVPTVAKVDGGTFTNDAASNIFVYEHLPISTMNARLSIISNDSQVVSGEVTSSNLFYVPHNGRNVWLYDDVNTRWEPWTLTTQITKDISGLTANTVYDVFLFDNGGSLDLEFVGWANFNTRTTALTTQDGVLVRTGNLTQRFVGTIQTTSSNDLFHRIGGSYNTQVPIGATYTNWYNPLSASGYSQSSTTELVAAPTILFQPTCGYYQGLIGNLKGVDNTPSIHYSFTGLTDGALVADYRIRTLNKNTSTVVSEMTTINSTHAAVQIGGSVSNAGKASGNTYILFTVHPVSGTISNLITRCDFSWKM